MPNPVADVLRRAADRVARGIVRNRDHFAEDAKGHEVSPNSRNACRWCMAGALKADGSGDLTDAYFAARSLLTKRLGQDCIWWFYGRDLPKRPSKREVVAALRAAADAAEGRAEK